VGKNKLARWEEMATFPNVIQPAEEIRFGKDHPLKGNWKTDIFRNGNPVNLELACGKGEYTIALAERYPDRNYIGVDIKGARMWRGAKTARERDLQNVVFLRTRIEFIRSFFGEDEVDEIWITFPDPHPGRRNSNKRLTSPWFLNLYRYFLKNNGIIHLKTDNDELFRYTCSIVKGNDLGIISATDNLYADNLAAEILSVRTYYENIFLNEGSTISYISFTLNKNKNIEDVIQQQKGQ